MGKSLKRRTYKKHRKSHTKNRKQMQKILNAFL